MNDIPEPKDVYVTLRKEFCPKCRRDRLFHLGCRFAAPEKIGKRIRKCDHCDFTEELFKP